ncbi:MAG TPA: thermonuclease family protein [archaeon]|nr:thermonuclease family protein [archaeon]
MKAVKLCLIFLVLYSTSLTAAEKNIVQRVNQDGSLKLSLFCSVKLAGLELPAGFGSSRLVEFYNHEALEALKELVTGKEVTVDYVKSRRWLPFGRKAYVYVDTVFVNAWLLREGCARCDKKYDHRLARDFADYEKSARKAKKGLWLSPFSHEDNKL